MVYRFFVDDPQSPSGYRMVRGDQCVEGDHPAEIGDVLRNVDGDWVARRIGTLRSGEILVDWHRS